MICFFRQAWPPASACKVLARMRLACHVDLRGGASPVSLHLAEAVAEPASCEHSASLHTCCLLLQQPDRKAGEAGEAVP